MQKTKQRRASATEGIKRIDIAGEERNSHRVVCRKNESAGGSGRGRKDRRRARRKVNGRNAAICMRLGRILGRS